MTSDIRKYILDKLFFPKVVVIDRPGVIINRIASRYGGKSNQLRTLYDFEEVYINLQLETLKKLGKEKTGKIYYILGKEIGKDYISQFKIKKPPLFLTQNIIIYMLKNLGWMGLYFSDREYNPKEKIIVLRGKNVPLADKVKEYSIFLGFFSSLFSVIFGENIEGEFNFDENFREGVYTFKKSAEKFFYEFKIEDSEFKKYYSLNFPEKFPKLNYSSILDFIKFKKIKMGDEGKMFFMEKHIIPATSDFLNLIARYYIYIGEKNVLEKGLVEGAEKLASEILGGLKTKEDKIKNIENILCVFGWGIPRHKEDSAMIFDFFYPPISKYGFFYQALVLNGYLNFIFKKKLKIDKILISPNPPKIRVSFISKSNSS